MVVKMVGKKGRSGRKTRDDGLKARAVALYIDHMEWQHLATGKTEHTPVGWFQQFKRIYGNRWQEKVRTLIQIQVRKDQDERMWPCSCSGITKWHFRAQAQCPKCEEWINENERRIHGG